MKARFKYRLYPTEPQRLELARLFGCCRVVWNDALVFCQGEYLQSKRKPSYNELSKRLTALKKTEDREWLTEVSSIPLQQSLRDLEQAYSNFFNSCTGKRNGSTTLTNQGVKVKSPRLKKRKSKQSARFMDNGFKLIEGKLKLPKIGEL